MAHYKVGDFITRNGINLLILDIVDDKPFVIALDTGLKGFFGRSNNYYESDLKRDTEHWFYRAGFHSIPRKLDLTTMDSDRASSNNREATDCVDVAPLTFDEYHKYSSILIPRIRSDFWLCSSQRDPEYAIGDDAAQFVNSIGDVGLSFTFWSHGIAPAFILDGCVQNTLSDYSTDELLAEIKRRMEIANG